MKVLQAVVISLVIIFGCTTTMAAEATINIYNDDDFDGIADILKVKQRKGTIEFGEVPRQITLEIEFFHKGKKIDSTHAVEVRSVNVQELNARFLICIVDLDHVRLTDGNEGECRWFLKLKGLGAEVGESEDVSKEKFGWQALRTGDFGQKVRAKRGEKAPVFWFGNIEESKRQPAEGPMNRENLQKEYAKGDLAIVSVTWK